MNKEKVFCKNCFNNKFFRTSYFILAQPPRFRPSLPPIENMDICTVIKETRYDPVFGKQIVFSECRELNKNFDCEKFDKLPLPPKSLWEKFKGIWGAI